MDRIKAGIQSRGNNWQTEFPVKTPGGIKAMRAVDVAEKDPLTGRPIGFYQVGDLTAVGGIPVKRERDAIWDILLNSEYGDVPIRFVPKDPKGR